MSEQTTFTRNPLVRMALASTVALGLGACGSTHETAMPRASDAQKRAEVHLARLTHVVKFGGKTNLSAIEAAALNAFVANNKVGYGDTVSIDVSGGSALRRAAVAEQLRLNGISLAADAPVLPEGPQPGTAMLIVERYTVTPPACPDWSRATTPNYENLNSSNFGCATQTNLAMMVANPKDLIEGQSANGTALGDAATRPNEILRGIQQTQGVTSRGLVLSSGSGGSGGSSGN